MSCILPAIERYDIYDRLDFRIETGMSGSAATNYNLVARGIRIDNFRLSDQTAPAS